MKYSPFWERNKNIHKLNRGEVREHSTAEESITAGNGWIVIR